MLPVIKSFRRLVSDVVKSVTRLAEMGEIGFYHDMTRAHTGLIIDF